MRNKDLTIAAILLGTLALLAVICAGDAVAGPPLQGPGGGDETQAVMDDGFWYQGRLTDGDGNPLANTNVNVTFRLYNVSSGGAALDSVVVTVNTDSNGLFNEVIDFNWHDVFDGQALYLGLQVAGEASEMTPRQYLRPVPYALSLRPGAWVQSDSSDADFAPVLSVRHEVVSTTADHDALFGSSESAGEGVQGSSAYGSGVYGQTEANQVTDRGGVYGYSTNSAPGVKGYSAGGLQDYSYGGYFTSGNRRGLYARGASGFYAAYFQGGGPPTNNGIYVNGDIDKSGTNNAALAIEGQGTRRLYSIESPSVWFEDFGQGQLVNGQATVTIESLFLQTINTEVPYHVFLTPLGDCNGLYVTNKTATSFEVRELGGGTANVAFDYRIVAIRKGYEGVRMEPITEGGKPFVAEPTAPFETAEPEVP